MNMNNQYELSFHKVFHNKYILRKILNYIHSSEHIEYGEVHQIYFRNRIKFKDIKSLGFLVSNDQIPLLKCKLESNEYIEMDVRSIQSLFKNFSSESDSGTIEKIINLLMVNERRNNFEICDLTEMSIKCNSIEVFNILINEPYSLQVLPSTLKEAIRNCSVTVVKQLLDLQIKSYGKHIIELDIQEKSFIYATENKVHGEEMVKFILSNSILFNLTSTSKVLTNNKRIKTLNQRKNKLDHLFFSKLTCWETKMKLVEMGLVSKKRSHLSKFSNSKDIDSLSYRELYIAIVIDNKFNGSNKEIISNITQYRLSQFNDNSTNVAMNEKERIKELRKLITKIQPSDYYEQYIIRYHETINEVHIGDGFTSNNDGSFESELLNLVRFIYIYNGSKMDEYVISTMNKYKSQIPTATLQQQLSFSIFNYIKSGKLTITDKPTIDLLVAEYPMFIEIIGNCNHVKINFSSSVQVLKYMVKEDLYIKIRQSILNLDIESLKYLKPFIFHQYDPLNDLKDLQINSNNYNQFIMMFDYFLQIKFINFGPIENTLSRFLNIVLKNSGITNGNLQLDSIKSRIKDGFSKDVIESFFRYSVVNLHFKLIRFYLDWFQGEYTLLSNQLERYLYIFDSSYRIYRPSYKSNKNMIGKLVSVLEYSINEYSKPNTTFKGKGSYEILINNFFEKLIQIQGVGIETVNTIYRSMVSNGITVTHGLYHSFYYISIKSIKLSKYILSNPYLLTPMENDRYYDCLINYYESPGIYDISNYLKPHVFSFDFIFNSDQDTILNKLIDVLSHDSIKDSEVMVSGFILEILNSDLRYCLEIQRVDLFFQQLEYINVQLNNNYNQFPKDSIYPTFNSTFNSPALSFKHGSDVDQQHQQELPTATTSNLTWFIPSKYNISKSFKISNDIIEIGSILFNVENVEKFIEYNKHVTGFHISLLECAIRNWNEPIVKYIIDNYYIPQHCLLSNEFTESNHYIQLKFIFENYFNQVSNSNPIQVIENYNNYQFKYFLLKAYNQFINYINYGESDYNEFNQLPTDHKSKVMEKYYNSNPIYTNVTIDRLFNNVNLYNVFDSVDIQSIIIPIITKLFTNERDDYKTVGNYETDNLFYNSFSNGYIDQCNLVLKYYPNQFTISKSLLSKTIKNNQIHIIKYYYQNQNNNLISNFNNNKELIDHLKNELSPLLNWLK